MYAKERRTRKRFRRVGEKTGGGAAEEEGARGQPLALLPLSPGWLEGDEPKSALIRSEGRSVLMGWLMGPRRVRAWP